MATTENTYTGDGSTVLYNFTFPYIDETDVYVSLDGTATTAYSYANATTIQFTTAPASGVAIKIFRATDSSDTKAAFFAGSAIRSKDLNDNFTQSLYIAQESENVADDAKTQAANAETSAATANTNATAAAASAATATAQATASAASAATAQAQATQAGTDATAAQTSATAAQTSATAAQNSATAAAADAATATTDAQTAISTANSATTTANTANTNATTALSRVNTYLHDGTNPVGDGVGNNPQGLLYAINTANTATTTANSATTTANTASTNASAAVTTANAASATATAASNAVAAAAFYSPYAALANLPSSPSNGDRAEVANSTGVESSTAVDGVPSGFVGATDLTVRLQYNGTSGKWDWQNYFASDPDNRYLTESQPVVKGDSTNGSGEITLNCENNSHGVKIKGPAHSAAATYTLTLPDDTGTSGQALTTDGNGALSFSDIASSILTQTDFAYKPSSNTATLAGPSVTSSPSGINAFQGLHAHPNQSTTTIRFEKSTNTQFYNLVNQLSSGDSVSVTWNNVGTVRTDSTTFNSLSDNTINNVIYGELVLNSSLGSFATGANVYFAIQSSQIINGTEPIYNNQVLRYKTATQKWTVDDAEVIAILDGGNFASGASLVQTSNTYDGGSF